MNYGSNCLAVKMRRWMVVVAVVLEAVLGNLAHLGAHLVDDKNLYAVNWLVQCPWWSYEDCWMKVRGAKYLIRRPTLSSLWSDKDKKESPVYASVNGLNSRPTTNWVRLIIVGCFYSSFSLVLRDEERLLTDSSVQKKVWANSSTN